MTEAGTPALTAAERNSVPGRRPRVLPDRAVRAAISSVVRHRGPSLRGASWLLPGQTRRCPASCRFTASDQVLLYAVVSRSTMRRWHPRPGASDARSLDLDARLFEGNLLHVELLGLQVDRLRVTTNLCATARWVSSRPPLGGRAASPKRLRPRYSRRETYVGRWKIRRRALMTGGESGRDCGQPGQRGAAATVVVAQALATPGSGAAATSARGRYRSRS